MVGHYTVPGAFTRAGQDQMTLAILNATQELGEDDWVMGESGKKGLAQATDAAKMQERYYRDYADHWLKFVKGVEIKPYKTKADATNALQSFSQSNSPIEILVKEIAKNTNLSAKADNMGWIDWIKSFFVKKKDNSTGGTPPETEFRALFTFVGTKEKPEAAPVAKYRGILGQVFNDLNGLSDDRLKKIAEQLANDENEPLKIKARETAILALLGGFKDTPSGQAMAELLQKPLGNLKSMLGADAQGQIVKMWNEQIVPDAKEIEKAYPFEDSPTEIDMTKLSAFLAPGEGKFSKFYDERLSRYFEESGGQFKLKDTAEVKFSDEFIAYMNNLLKLRKQLYGSGNTPKVDYEFTMQPATGATVEITIDGQPATASTGSMKGTFPGTGSTETGVFINLGSAASTTTTAAPASNSNTAAGPAAPANATSKYPGTWGLFRFVEASKPQKQSGGVYGLTITAGKTSVSATIKSSGEDLFDRAFFKQIRVPQTFLK
jgi:type VI secretion system protein ImpL